MRSQIIGRLFCPFQKKIPLIFSREVYYVKAGKQYRILTPALFIAVPHP
jgi:hypothetical protein